MLENPVAGTERILPWIVAVHAKDGGLKFDESGLVSFTTQIGTGQVDFVKIASLLSTLERRVHLSVEDHGGSFSIPIFDQLFLSRFPDLHVTELGELVKLAKAGSRLLKNGEIALMERKDWPLHCEKRLSSDINNLKSVLRR